MSSVAVPTQRELHAPPLDARLARLSRDARVALATAAGGIAEQHPRLFAVTGSQRAPRCYGRVSYPAVSWTERQHHLRFSARRWWVVRCSNAADGARVIEQLLALERTPLGLKRFAAAVLERPDLRQILDAGRNARGAA